MFSRLSKFFSVVQEKPQLGRWSLKSCEELAASINSIYQNRDHCSDIICKTPKKAEEYMDRLPNNADIFKK